MDKKPQVILARCDSYDPDRITEIVADGMKQMGLSATGKTIVKPNVVMAHPKYFPYAYTRSEVTEGVVRAARKEAKNLESLRIAERCGITIPTRFAFKFAGYTKMAKRIGVDLVSLEEVPQVEVPLKRPERLRDYLYTPEPIANCDFMITVPKFKAHPWTTVTFALKNWIGIQDDRHRLIDHDHHLDMKIADLQEIVSPDFIVIDGIVGGQDRMLTCVPYDLNLIVMGNNSVATDAVCSNILGLDPAEIDHIRFCHERGLGPLSLDEIDVTGDVSLKTAKADAAGFRTGLIRVEDYFEKSPITAYAGPPEEKKDCEYCWGGCPGALEEAIEIIHTTDPEADSKMKPIHTVFGRYEGSVDAKPGEKVLFIGDCAHWKGELQGEKVTVESVYGQEKKDPRRAGVRDIFLKMIVVFFNCFKKRKKVYIRVRGCPVSVAETVLYLSRTAKTKNPYFDFRIVVPFVLSWVGWRLRSIGRRLLFIPYQRKPKKLLEDQSNA